MKHMKMYYNYSLVYLDTVKLRRYLGGVGVNKTESAACLQYSNSGVEEGCCGQRKRRRF